MTTPQGERILAYDRLVAHIESVDFHPLVREIAQARLRVNHQRDNGKPVDPLDDLRMEILSYLPEPYVAAVRAMTQAIARKDEILDWTDESA